jgi:hypothetical protein
MMEDAFIWIDLLASILVHQLSKDDSASASGNSQEKYLSRIQPGHFVTHVTQKVNPRVFECDG